MSRPNCLCTWLPEDREPFWNDLKSPPKSSTINMWIKNPYLLADDPIFTPEQYKKMSDSFEAHFNRQMMGAFGIPPEQFGEVSTVSSHKPTTLTIEDFNKSMKILDEAVKRDQELDDLVERLRKLSPAAALSATALRGLAKKIRDAGDVTPQQIAEMHLKSVADAAAKEIESGWSAGLPPLRLNETSSPSQKSTSEFERWMAGLPEWQLDNDADYSFVNFHGEELSPDQVTASFYEGNGLFPFSSKVVLNKMNEGVIQIDYERDLMCILNGVFVVIGYDPESNRIFAEWDGD